MPAYKKDQYGIIIPVMRTKSTLRRLGSVSVQKNNMGCYYSKKNCFPSRGSVTCDMFIQFHVLFLQLRRLSTSPSFLSFLYFFLPGLMSLFHFVSLWLLVLSGWVVVWIFDCFYWKNGFDVQEKIGKPGTKNTELLVSKRY